MGLIVMGIIILWIIRKRRVLPMVNHGAISVMGKSFAYLRH